MYVKFFSNKKGGSAKSIAYLLNEREEDGTARVLEGDPDVTKQLINSINRKQKATVGCLSFSEKDPLSFMEKMKMMEDFEKTLLPGLDKSQYNILWVEHTDKNRLELNFVIPKVELSTQKALQPYYHNADFSRIDMFEDIQNIKYNLSSKKDSARASTIVGSKKEIKLYKDYKKLDEQLHELVADGQIQNRKQMIELLKSSSIEVTRIGKDYLSIKLPDSKKAKKFKGGIYHEQFTSPEQLKTISFEAEQRAREFATRDTQKELRTTRERLKNYNERKARELTEKYKSSKMEGDSINVNNIPDSRNNSRNNNKRETAISTQKYGNSNITEQQIYKNSEKYNSNKKEKRQQYIYKSRRLVDDSTRATITRDTKRETTKQLTARTRGRLKVKIRRNRATRESRNRAYIANIQEKNRKFGDRIYQKITDFGKQILEKIIKKIQIQDRKELLTELKELEQNFKEFEQNNVIIENINFDEVGDKLSKTATTKQKEYFKNDTTCQNEMLK